MSKSSYILTHERRNIPLESLKVVDGALREAFTIVRQLINSCVPIHKLPPEILSDIFHFVPDWLDELDEMIGRRWSPSECVDTRQLVPVTAVCQYWRRVALETPSLWTTVYDKDCSHLRYDYADPLHRLWIDRSANAALHVCSHRLLSELTFDIITRQSSRIHDLHLISSLPRNAWNNQESVQDNEHVRMNAVLAAPLTNVEACRLEDIYRQPPFVHLFSGKCIRLQELHLTHTCFLPSHPISSLTRLSICNPPRPYHTCRNVLDDVLKLLGGLPQLNKLHLGSFVSRTSTITSTWPDRVGKPITLPHLDTFIYSEWVLSDHPSIDGFLSKLLAHIVLPETCARRFGQMIPSEFSGSASAVSNSLPTNTQATHLCISSMREHAFNSIYSVVVTRPASSQHACFDFSRHHHPHSWENGDVRELPWPALRSVLSNVRMFSAIQELYLHAGQDTVWFSHKDDSILPHLPHLRVLVLSLERPTRVHHLLCALEPDSDASPTPTVHCPALTAITITCPKRRAIAYRGRQLLLNKFLGRNVISNRKYKPSLGLNVL
ncbi:hypothetical protein C8Q76DRAFT_436068 [Earliella scabrosa]|nr:hypothetical protein C8Q76DRAFT_436068 [Earliella scabrosa]